MIIYCSPNESVFQRWDTATGEGVTLTTYDPALASLASAVAQYPITRVDAFGSASLAANGEVWVSIAAGAIDGQAFAILDPATLAPRLVKRIPKGNQQGTSNGFTRPEFAGFAPVDGKNWTVYTQQGGV